MDKSPDGLIVFSFQYYKYGKNYRIKMIIKDKCCHSWCSFASFAIYFDGSNLLRLNKRKCELARATSCRPFVKVNLIFSAAPEPLKTYLTFTRKTIYGQRHHLLDHLVLKVFICLSVCFSCESSKVVQLYIYSKLRL